MNPRQTLNPDTAMLPERKVCTKCGVEKGREEFRVRTIKYKNSVYTSLRSHCRLCEIVSSKNLKPEQKVKRQIAYKKWAEKNVNHLITYRKIKNGERADKDPTYHARWRDSNREKLKLKSNFLSKRAIQELRGAYVVQIISRATNMTTEQVREHPELIRLTKTIIQLKRKTRDGK